MRDFLVDFFFGPDAEAWNTALGIGASIAAILTACAATYWFVHRRVVTRRQDTADQPPEPGDDSLPSDPEAQVLWSGFPQGDALIGRDYEIAEIRMRLNNTGEVAVVNSGAIVSGQGGISKTTLARGFAETHRRDYDGGLWIGA